MRAKVNLLRHSMMTPMERQMGRFMRAPDHDQGGNAGAGGESNGAGDNNQGAGGGNNGTAGNESGSENNSSSGFNPETFWNEPGAGDKGSPSGGSVESKAPASGDQQQQQQPANPGQALAQEFQQQFTTMKFGGGFTQETIKAIEEGDMEKANAGFQQMQRESVQTALSMAAKLMKVHQESLMGNVQKMIKEHLGQRDTSDVILKNFPAAKDPTARPVIQGIFEQSLKHTNGDHDKAVAMAKGMLAHMGKIGRADMGITEPPANPGDGTMDQAAKDLVADLLSNL